MSRHLERNLKKAFGDLTETPDLTEIAVNADRSVWIARNGDPYMRQINLPLPETEARALADDLTGEDPISENNPSGGSLFFMDGSLWRSQVILNPLIEGAVAFALRRTVVRRFSLDDLVAGSEIGGLTEELKTGISQENEAVFAAYDQGDFVTFLRAAVQAKWNILLSGGTDSGKTTWLRACLECADPTERVITIEDTREIYPNHANHLSMLVNETTTSSDLLKISLRLRPDRILMGELRGADAYDFLSAINSGHPGGITTLHASSPDTALSRLALMVMQAETGLTFSEIIEYCRSMIDVVVQFKKVNGIRKPSGVEIFRPRTSNAEE
ncbi:ATPase, T2SS/T4P/T4SS family [Pelagibius sp. Alg239-R121]|uniref:ATPase, T2SS/T4P/T4SS family n=1 Tax=Pelagibius sp. Alg239-R121 TaxID=2993448 RepID=UPI0024A62939|nr:ATPase, T2SS/T4P/T4SS family [Pelagibius sp. Alg239-R121]